MVVGAFPAAKLAALLLKQVSKPIANVIKNRAKQHPFFRTYICMPPAQFYNWCEVQTKMWVLNLGKPVNVPVLNEAMAIELGANLLGEGIIFVVAAGALIAEYNRSSNKEAAKEATKAEELAALNSTLMELYMTTERQATEIRELRRIVYDLDTRVVQKPWIPKKEIPPPEPEQPPAAPIKILGKLEQTNYDASKANFKLTNLNFVETNNTQESVPKPLLAKSMSMLFNALEIVEDNWLSVQDSQQSLLLDAVDYIYEDVLNV